MHKKAAMRRIVELCLIIGVIGVLLLLLPQMNKERSDISMDLRRTTGWYYLQNGEKISVELPARIAVPGSDELVLYNDAITRDDAGMTLTTMAAAYDLQILYDDQVLYSFNDDKFPHNEQMKGKMSCSCNLPGDLEVQKLQFIYRSVGDGIFEVPDILIGSSAGVLRYFYMESTSMVLLSLVMLLGGFLSAGVAIYLARYQIQEHRFKDVALFLLLSAAWSITDSPLLRVYSGQTAIINTISFFAFMTFSIPMVHFIYNTGQMKRYKILDVWILLFYVNAIVQGVLCLTNLCAMISMLFVTHILLFTGVGICIWTLIMEYRRTGDQEVRSILAAFSALGGIGVLTILLYWIFKINFYVSLFQFGILIFGIIILNQIIHSMIANFRYRTEMEVYERLSREDEMTGLGNGKAFDEHIISIEMGETVCSNAALIFLDVNDLRKTNNHLGHSAGDELVVSAAWCIRQAFAEIGKCFRLSGDEFSVVVLDPVQTEAELLKMLDDMVVKYNRNHKYPVSVTRGISFLARTDGTKKRVSDWKYEADRSLYGDRSRENNHE